VSVEGPAVIACIFGSIRLRNKTNLVHVGRLTSLIPSPKAIAKSSPSPDARLNVEPMNDFTYQK
jgi:hypothetical protein